MNIGTASEHLSAKQLDEAIKVLQPIYDGKPSLVDYDKFIAIANDYDLMCDYMLRGFKDPAREGLYKSLLEGYCQLVAKLELQEQAYFRRCFSHCRPVEPQPQLRALCARKLRF